MLKKPFITPVLTEFGRFDEIVLGEGNPICGAKDAPGQLTEGGAACNGGSGGYKPAAFCDAWNTCGSS